MKTLRLATAIPLFLWFVMTATSNGDNLLASLPGFESLSKKEEREKYLKVVLSFQRASEKDKELAVKQFMESKRGVAYLEKCHEIKSFLIVAYDVDMKFCRESLHLSSNCIRIEGKTISFSSYSGSNGVGFGSGILDFKAIKGKPDRNIAEYQFDFRP